MPKKKPPTKKPTHTKKVTITQYSQFTQKAIRNHYEELKAQKTIKGSFQSYLNTSGQKYFDSFFKELSKSAGKFAINAIINIASGEYSRYFIKHPKTPK
jgi:hypothetical protein